MIKLVSREGSKDVTAALASGGLGVPDSFDYPQPKIPEDLTSLTDSDLMGLYLLFNEYNNFLLMQVSIAKVDADYYSKLRSIEEARFILEAPKGETVAKTKARCLLDPDYIKALNMADSTESYATIVEAIQKTSSESMWVIKGEITRRRSNASFSQAARGYSA